MDALKTAEIKVQKETNTAVEHVFRTMAIALNELGWKYIRINNVCKEINKLFSELNKEDKSAVQILDEETGIEIMSDKTDKHWYELPYLNSKVFDIYLQNNGGKISKAYLINVKYAMCKWARPQIYATVFIALHRKYGFGAERIAKIYQRMEEIDGNYDFDVKKLESALIEVLKLKLVIGNGTAQFVEVE